MDVILLVPWIELKWGMFVNKIMTRMFEHKNDGVVGNFRKLYNGVFYNVCYLNNIRMMK
jgi:hypothetical protein